MFDYAIYGLEPVLTSITSLRDGAGPSNIPAEHLAVDPPVVPPVDPPVIPFADPPVVPLSDPPVLPLQEPELPPLPPALEEDGWLTDPEYESDPEEFPDEPPLIVQLGPFWGEDPYLCLEILLMILSSRYQMMRLHPVAESTVTTEELF
ncbi:uncharacterized protein LOC142528231 [Primulina tabacum]|uniref:uncharacterized protein LOC142528231 n=1 Tax=Primulina tabacum TaxID=48773 RepID=UPI003F592A30